ncbi:MAG: pilus assembly protein PilM [Candidatus Eremiobacteraeota bacterium]|nr:pilus assembly protein PilM [Candidatus Eremiobacteraeota bacterium]
MLIRSTTTPLGIDIGTTRVRVAMGKRDRRGQFVLTAVATKELGGTGTFQSGAAPEAIAAAIRDLVKELGVAQRSCVLSLSPPAAMLRVVRLAAMTPAQQREAARYEAERFAPWNVAEVASVVRVRALGDAQGLFAVGIAREDVLAERVASVRRAGLRVAGIDHDACALRRAFPLAGAVLDIGYCSSRLHAFLPAGSLCSFVAAGGLDVTLAIARDLRIDDAAAEKRKRIFGTAGAGEPAKVQFVDAIRRQVEKLPNVLKRLALVGNGSRLAGLAGAIESATQANVELPASDLLRYGAYPEDIVRAAGPDWTLAASLAGWTPC